MDEEHITFQPDRVSRGAFIASTAVVLGHVDIEAKASVWFNAVVRGDGDRIVIGEGSNVQDQAVLHADPGFPCLLGHRVTVGHSAIVHGAVVEDDVLIGMRAVIMNGARIGRGSLIGVGAVILEGIDIPPESVVVGMPGTMIRRTSDRDWERIRHAANHYIAAAREYARRYPRE